MQSPFDPLPELTVQEWSEAFHIATLWGFEQLRAYIIKTTDSIAQDPIDRIQLADKCGLTEWLHPAYAKLCARDSSLTAEDGRKLGFERFAVLSRIREDDFKTTIGSLNSQLRQNSFGRSVAPEPKRTSERFLKKIADAEALKVESNQH